VCVVWPYACPLQGVQRSDFASALHVSTLDSGESGFGQALPLYARICHSAGRCCCSKAARRPKGCVQINRNAQKEFTRPEGSLNFRGYLLALEFLAMRDH
jgi:hypothetical protein